VRFRSGSRDDPATRSRPPMDAPKGKNPPFAIFAGPRAGCSRDSATVQAEKERSRAKPDRSSLRVSPIPRRPEGLAARSGASLGLMLTLRYGRSAAVSYGVRTRFDGHADTPGTIDVLRGLSMPPHTNRAVSFAIACPTARYRKSSQTLLFRS